MLKLRVLPLGLLRGTRWEVLVLELHAFKPKRAGFRKSDSLQWAYTLTVPIFLLCYREQRMMKWPFVPGRYIP